MPLKNLSLDELARRNEASKAKREQEKRDEQHRKPVAETA